uniref:RNA-directed DNA polymerase n=2 Tax=Lygus hesperus TaxID=30085 RepID=A0A146M1A3_LYGHE
MCVDYRRLNAITEPAFYPLPRIDEYLDKLGGSKLFTTLDLKSGYYQVTMAPEDAAKTAFVTDEGCYEYTRLPFGLQGAPATFQRLAMMLIKQLGSLHALAFLDDLILFHPDLPSHNRDLRQMLQVLRTAGLTLQLSKCYFAQSEVGYLGHIVSKEGIRPDDRKLRAVAEFGRPSNIKQLRSFLGLCSYYRRFVENFAKIAKPLNDLSKKEAEFVWSPQCEEAFQTLKTRLVTPPVLAYPDFSKPFILATDGSKEGLGCVLSQVIDGVEHPVAYASRRTSHAEERSYCATDLELAALVYGIDQFRHYLWGVEFTVITDHSALRYLNTHRDLNSRLTRWALKLSEFRFTIQHKAGAAHSNADALSRCYICFAAEAQHWPTLQVEEIKQHQDTDEDIKALHGSSDLFKTSSNGLLCKVTTAGWKIVLPAALRQRVLELHHDLPQSGHGGTQSTLTRIKQAYWWPGLRRDVANYVKSCHACAQRKHYGRKVAPLGELSEPSACFDQLSTDIVGPLPLTPRGHRYILSVLDQFSRHVEFYPLTCQSSEAVAQALLQHFGRYGAPKQLLSDQGADFTSELVRHFCQFFQVNRVCTTAYHPMSNGRVERVHRTMADILSHYVNAAQNNWDECLPLVQMVINSNIHTATKFSPYEVVYGRAMRLPAPADMDLGEDVEPYVNHVEQLRTTLEALWQKLAAAQRVAVSKQRAGYDKKATETTYRVGDRVYLYNPAVKRGRVRKFTKPWQGPYRVVGVPSPLNVVLQIRGKQKRVHVNRVKLATPRHPRLLRSQSSITRNASTAPAIESATASSPPLATPIRTTLEEAAEPEDLSPGPEHSLGHVSALQRFTTVPPITYIGDTSYWWEDAQPPAAQSTPSATPCPLQETVHKPSATTPSEETTPTRNPERRYNTRGRKANYRRLAGLEGSFETP